MNSEDIYLFTLYNKRDTVVTITNYGAIITSIKIKMDDGSTNDVVLGFDKVEDYWSPGYLAKHPWFGCAVGRYSNRIKNACFELDGKMYYLSRNNGDEQLHGGVQGFDQKFWQL